ncbi:uncharacterized protein [Ptychodera flava]|uniref:uncharacterized protein n=1 Tax=Ptychodera flava TaxID=63121 RepID=UPI00396AA1A9
MEVKSATSHGLSTYESLLDHGIRSPMTSLPSIPCSKYIVLGNPKMRVPRKRTAHVVWRVPRVQPRRRRRAVFRRVDASDSNEFDQDTLYSDRYGHDEMKILPPLLWDDGQPKNTDLMKEKELIEKYRKGLSYEQIKMQTKLTSAEKVRQRERAVTRVTFKLPPIDEFENGYENGVVIQDSPRDDDESGGSKKSFRRKRACLSPNHKKVCKGSPVCEGEAREFCDVLGQGYCSCCLAYYNRKKHERLMLPIIRANTPKSTTTTSLSRAIQKGAYDKKRSTRKKGKALTSMCLCSKLPRLENNNDDDNAD